MHLKLALKTLATAALLLSASIAFAEDPVDTPLPGDVQTVQPSANRTVRHRSSTAATNKASKTSAPATTTDNVTTTKHASSHKHTQRKAHISSRRHSKTATTKHQAKQPLHKKAANSKKTTAKKPLHSKKAPKVVRSKSTAHSNKVKTDTKPNDKTNLVTQERAGKKTASHKSTPAKTAHAKTSKTQTAAAHKKAVGKSVKNVKKQAVKPKKKSNASKTQAASKTTSAKHKIHLKHKVAHKTAKQTNKK